MTRSAWLLAIPLLLTANGCRQEHGATHDDTVDTVEAAASAGRRNVTLTGEGWGLLRIGMTRAQVVAALGEDAAPDAVGGPDPSRCDEFRPRLAPRGMLVMIERGVLTRITLTRESEIRTSLGIRAGDSSAKVEEAFSDLFTTAPHQYLAAPARYLTVWTTVAPDDRARGIRFVVDTDDRVALIYAGTRSIEYVEGCV